MELIQWSPNLSVGIDVIDEQHIRIVDYTNHLIRANQRGDKDAVGDVLVELMDYTQSHFAFEESLMAQADYPHLQAHKKVHELFTRKVEDYQRRYLQGEGIADELLQTLTTWLLNHINKEDAVYSNDVMQAMADGRIEADSRSEGSWLGRALRRFFGSA